MTFKADFRIGIQEFICLGLGLGFSRLKTPDFGKLEFRAVWGVGR